MPGSASPISGIRTAEPSSEARGGPTAAAAVSEDTRIARQFGSIEFIRRLREDELSILVPEVFSRNLLHQRLLFLFGGGPRMRAKDGIGVTLEPR